MQYIVICGSGGSKSRLAKAAGAEPSGQMRGEQLHAVVARSTFPSQNVQNTPGPDHFWQLRCRKSARRCGAKHISKSKCTKHTILGPLLEVEMSKKCTPLWREAHFEVNMYKTHHSRTTFGSWDVEKVHAVVARSTFRGSDHFWRFRCRNSARLSGEKHISKSKGEKKHQGGPTTFGGSDVASRGRRKGLCTLSKVSKTCGFCSIFNYNHHYTTLHSYTPIHYTTLQLRHTTTTTTPSLHSTTLHSTTLHCTQLHSITLHYTTLHYTPLHYTTLHYTSLHYTTLHSTTLQLQLQLHNYTHLHTTTLHYTTLHYTTLHYATTTTTTATTQLHSTTITLHYTPLHYITLHYIPLHFTTLHYTTLNYTTTTITTTQLHSTPLHFTTLHYTTLHYTTTTTTKLHSTPLRYT